MAVDFVAGVGGGEGEGIEGVVDAGGVEGGGGGRGRRGGGVELGEVEGAGFFRGRFTVFGEGAGILFFGGEEGVFFGFFARRFEFFLVFGFSVVRGVVVSKRVGFGRDGGWEACFLEFDFAPLLHSCSSAAAFFALSAAAFWLATSAFWGVGG